MVVSGQYNMVAHKLQEICDRLPAHHIKHQAGAHGGPVKTANISSDEQSRINADWKKKAKN
jgi:hypothetical protein